VSNHATNTKCDCHPVSSCLSSPTIHHISNRGIDEREAQSPQAHLRLFHTTIPACEAEDDLVRQDASTPSYEVADKSSKEYEAGR